jgi:hypothetical protein
MPVGMGIGSVGDPKTIIKRKFRWTFEISAPCGDVPIHYVKVAARPKLQIDPTEINFLNATSWIAGKAKWEPISVTYIDVASKDMEGLFKWFLSIYNFNKSVDLPMSEASGYAATGNLVLYDGCGQPLERWLFSMMWPELIDFGTVEYASSDEMTIELSLRYSDVRYESLCGADLTDFDCCKGCDAA